MSRNFGISNVRTDLRGRYEHPPARSRAVTQRDSNPLPSQSILHREDISYPTLDVGGVIRDAILGSITAVSLVASVFILLFVKT